MRQFQALTIRQSSHKMRTVCTYPNGLGQAVRMLYSKLGGVQVADEPKRAKLIEPIRAFVARLARQSIPTMPKEWISLGAAMTPLKAALILCQLPPSHTVIITSGIGLSLTKATSPVGFTLSRASTATCPLGSGPRLSSEYDEAFIQGTGMTLVRSGYHDC